MELLFPPDQNYDCLRCGKTCRSRVRIHVDPFSRRHLEGSELGRRIALQVGGPPVVEDADGAVVAARWQGHCAFLREDSLCSVQAELGLEEKPLGCRQYPLFLRPTPEGLVVGVSFFCSAVQQNHGRPLSAQAGEIGEILKGIRLRPVGFEPLPAGGGVEMDWPAWRALEAFLVDQLSREAPEVAFGRSVAALAALVAQGGAVGAERMAGALAGALPLEGRPETVAQEGFFAAALVAFVESEDPSATPDLTRALLAGGEVRLPRFGWSGSSAHLSAAPAWEGEPPEVRRYLRALLHRKMPALDRPVLDNLALLRLVPRLLDFYAAVSARARGAARREREDFFRALDVVELDVVSHARGLEGLFGAFSSFYVGLCGRR